MENAADKEDDYEIMPHREILELKKELERMKKNPLGRNKSAEDLLEGVNNLDHSINRLIEVFEHAADKLKEESHPIMPKESSVAQPNEVRPLISKIDQLIDQNKEIAEGIISVAQMIKRERKEVRNFEEQMKPAFRRPEPRPFTSEPRTFQSMMPTPEPRPMPSFNPSPMPSFAPSPSPAQSFTPSPATNPMPNYPRPTFPDMSVPPPQPQQSPSSFDFNMPPPPKLPEQNAGDKRKGFLF